MTQAEAFEAKLSTGGDSCVIRSKLLLNPNTAGASVASIVEFTPIQLGGRQLAAAQLFTLFRVKEAIVKFSIGTPSSSFATLGVLDDAIAEPDAPTSLGGVLELRASGSYLALSTVPTVFRWVPGDTSLWYHTSVGSTGSDPRLVIPGVLYGGTGAAGSLVIEVDITIVYKGATTVANN
jgi:hypothetical protein